MHSFTNESMERFRGSLHAMPQNLLINTITEYASMDTNLWTHLLVIASLHAKQPEVAYNRVKEHIDLVYGNDDIPHSLEHDEQIPFVSTQELIAQLLSTGCPLEASRACEHAFTYAENIAGVMWPDTFIQDCYDSIVETWIRAQKAMGTSPTELARRIRALEKYDEYCIFYQIEKLVTQHYGVDEADAYKELRRNAR